MSERQRHALNVSASVMLARCSPSVHNAEIEKSFNRASYPEVTQGLMTSRAYFQPIESQSEQLDVSGIFYSFKKHQWKFSLSVHDFLCFGKSSQRTTRT